MLGYHVFYRVTGSKKSYTTTEVYLIEKEARKRATELAIATNIDLVTIRMVDIKSLRLDVIKGDVEIDEIH